VIGRIRRTNHRDKISVNHKILLNRRLNVARVKISKDVERIPCELCVTLSKINMSNIIYHTNKDKYVVIIRKLRLHELTVCYGRALATLQCSKIVRTNIISETIVTLSRKQKLEFNIILTSSRKRQRDT